MRLLLPLVMILLWPSPAASQREPRARDLGALFDGSPGPLNAITDVPGVLVGQSTVITGEGAQAVRTGVTAILPRKDSDYYPAGVFVLNGDAEMSGAIFAQEFGMLRSPIMLTGTASNGTVFTSVIKWSLDIFPDRPVYMPVVADTWDADLSDALSFPLQESHVRSALDGAVPARSPKAASAAAPGWSASASRAASAPPRARSRSRTATIRSACWSSAIRASAKSW